MAYPKLFWSRLPTSLEPHITQTLLHITMPALNFSESHNFLTKIQGQTCILSRFLYFLLSYRMVCVPKPPLFISYQYLWSNPTPTLVCLMLWSTPSSPFPYNFECLIYPTLPIPHLQENSSAPTKPGTINENTNRMETGYLYPWHGVCLLLFEKMLIYKAIL